MKEKTQHHDTTHNANEVAQHQGGLRGRRQNETEKTVLPHTPYSSTRVYNPRTDEDKVLRLTVMVGGGIKGTN
jgi:hypothetical protein